MRLKGFVVGAVAVAALLSGCGGGASDAPASGSTKAATSAAAGSSGGGSAAVGSDEAWAAKFKKVVPAMADKPDAEVVAAGKKVCSDWKANPGKDGAAAMIVAAKAEGMDSIQANMWLAGAITHFCDDQSDAFMNATIG